MRFKVFPLYRIHLTVMAWQPNLKRIHPSTANVLPSDENSMFALSPMRTDALRSFITTASGSGFCKVGAARNGSRDVRRRICVSVQTAVFLPRRFGCSQGFNLAICNGTIAESCWKWTPIAAPQLLQLGSMECTAICEWSTLIPLCQMAVSGFVLGNCGLLRTCGRWLWITSTSIHQYSPTPWGFGVDFARIVSRCHHGGSQEGMAAVFAALWLSWMLMWGPSGKSPSCQQQWTDFDIISMFGATAPQRPIVLTCCGHSLLQSADFESPSHRIPCRIHADWGSLTRWASPKPKRT